MCIICCTQLPLRLRNSLSYSTSQSKYYRNKSKSKSKTGAKKSRAGAKQEQSRSKTGAKREQSKSRPIRFHSLFSTVCRFRLFSFQHFLIDRCSNTSCSLKTILLQLVCLFSSRRATFLIARVMMIYKCKLFGQASH